MQKMVVQQGQAANQPAARQRKGPAVESPQGEQIAQLEAMAERGPQADKLAQLAAMADASPTLAAQRRFTDMIHNSPAMAAQGKTIEGIHGSPHITAQRQETDEPLQAQTAQRAETPAKPNHTGLPDNLKSGIESLSGLSMDNVKVHYNSSQPAQLNALAYAQGTDIHVAPGQEQHLPHEAWHVVQQAQGRVKPTMQTKGMPVNDDQGLEREADAMGGVALQMHSRTPGTGISPTVSGGDASARVDAALTPAMLGTSVLQGVFAGFAGGGWGLDNTPLAGNLNIFPGGGNHAAGGQQGGATKRVINISTRNTYARPGELGGFAHFSTLFGNAILHEPLGKSGKAKRYTHMHVINGKTHGPGTVDNLILGSTGDNNRHRAQVEDAIRDGLPANDSATLYSNQFAAKPPFATVADVSYWNEPGGLAMVGAQKAAPGATVVVGGMAKPYTHSADPAALFKETHWAVYTVDPNYGGVLSPTIRANISARYLQLHTNESDDLEDVVHKMAPADRKAARTALLNANVAMNAQVTAVALAGGVAGVLAAGNAAADAFIQPEFSVGATAGDYATYVANMATYQNNMNNFAAWAAVSFPTDVTCDADLYRASYDQANPWYKRAEAQTVIPINQN